MIFQGFFPKKILIFSMQFFLTGPDWSKPPEALDRFQMDDDFTQSDFIHEIPKNQNTPSKQTSSALRVSGIISFLTAPDFGYLVPKSLSPASPRPGTIYPCSFSFSSMDAMKMSTSGCFSDKALIPSGAATRPTNLMLFAPLFFSI